MKYTSVRYPLFVGSMCTLLLYACGGAATEDGATSPTPEALNRPPVLTGSPATVVRVGETYYFEPTASDPDGDELVFAIENKPAWASFDDQTGTLFGTPAALDAGMHPSIAISVSDGEEQVALESFSVEVIIDRLARENFVPEGEITDTEDGYEVQGTLEIITGEDSTVRLENADLKLEFDEEGNLLDLAGEADLPPELTDNVAIETRVKARIGLYTGAEINADEDFGIQLRPQTSYLVFFVTANVDLTLGDRDGGPGESITLETPASGTILLILDPLDPFHYRFGSGPPGEYGFGQSLRGLIPFAPAFDFEPLASFDGHIIEKGSMSLGVKIFDFFNLSATRVTRTLDFDDIDWEDPLASPIAYQSGINGTADFGLSILGFGLFSIPVAETSATLTVGLDEQSMAMRTVIAPDVSWVPDWLSFVPATEVVGDWAIDGDDGFSASLNGTYRSTAAPADVNGRMILTPSGVTLRGTVEHDTLPLTVTAAFANETTAVEVEADIAFGGGIRDSVVNSLDAQLNEVERAYNDLQAAIADYDEEVSLKGLKARLPAICDRVLAQLGAIPNRVRSEVYDEVYAGTSACRPLCNRTGIANSAADRARDTAEARVRPYQTTYRNLRDRSREGDSDAWRRAIEQALRAAYDQRRFDETFTVTVSIPVVGNRTFRHREQRNILTPEEATQVLFAANNVYRIEETDSIRIRAQDVFDRLPVEESLQRARDEVDERLPQAPAFRGMGYTIRDDVVSAYVLLDDDRREVTFNVLDPEAALAGVGDLLAAEIVED